MIYTVCGINIDSAISLAGIFPPSAETRVDAFVKLVTTDQELPDGLPFGVSYDQNKKGLVATHPTVGSFLIFGGKGIKVRAKTGVPEAELANVLVTTPLAVLLLQRGLIPLHASAIETNRGALVFLGPPASGKSWMATWFQQRGCPVLADDLTVLSKDANGRVWVASGDGRLKLPRGAIRKRKGGVAELRPRVRKRVILATGLGVAKNVLLSEIYLLETAGRKGVVFRNIDEENRIPILRTNTYQSKLLDMMGMRPAYRKSLVDNLSTAPISVISIPEGINQIKLAAEKLTQAIKPLAQPAA